LCSDGDDRHHDLDRLRISLDGRGTAETDDRREIA
jgi:hypothetical protein